MVKGNRRGAFQVSLFVGLFCVVINGLYGVAALGAENEVSVKVASLFKAGWKPSIQGLKAAQAEYDEAAKLAPNDVRVPFAMALVSIQNHKYQDAAKQLDEALVGSKPMLPIRRVRIYVAVMLKDYSSAASQMRTLADRLPAEEQAGDAETPYREHAQFLGKVVEYLAHNADTQYKTSELPQLETHLTSKLKGERATAFTEARAEAAQQSSELDAKLADAKTGALAENTAKKDEAQEKVDALIAGLKAEADSIASQESSYRSANDAERRVAEVKAQQAQFELGRLNGQLVTYNRQINQFQSNIRNERAAAEKEKRKDNTAFLQQQLRRAEGDSQRIQSQISKTAAAGNESIAFMQRYNAELAKFAAAKKVVAGKLTKAKRQENAVGRMAVSDVNAKTSALDNELKAFSTYVGLSLDTEKERILATYRAK